MSSEQYRDYSPLDEEDITSSSENLLSSQSERASNEKNREEYGIQSLDDRRSYFQRNQRSLIVHLSLVALNVFFSLFVVNSLIARQMRGDRTSGNLSLREHLGSKQYQFDISNPFLLTGEINPHKPTSYAGPPRPELAHAWGNLTELVTIKVQDDELDEDIDRSKMVWLADDSGYFGSTAVFHGLHCIERLHHYLYKDHYYPGLPEDESARLLWHTEHCIDWIRQYIQCNVDTTFIMMYWQDDEMIPVSKDINKHQCANFDNVLEWATERKLDAKKPGLLVHPKLGVYWNGTGERPKGDNIGIAMKPNLKHGHANEGH